MIRDTPERNDPFGGGAKHFWNIKALSRKLFEIYKYLKQNDNGDSKNLRARALNHLWTRHTELYIGGVSHLRSSPRGKVINGFKKRRGGFVHDRRGLTGQFVENVVRRRWRRSAVGLSVCVRSRFPFKRVSDSNRLSIARYGCRSSTESAPVDDFGFGEQPRDLISIDFRNKIEPFDPLDEDHDRGN